MIFMIILVAFIVLVDVSGNTLTDAITPLIYVSSDEDEKEKQKTLEAASDLSPEELAEMAQNQIFGEEKGAKTK